MEGLAVAECNNKSGSQTLHCSRIIRKNDQLAVWEAELLWLLSYSVS